MRPSLLLFAVLCTLTAVVTAVGGAQAEPPTATACTESSAAITAKPAASGSAEQTSGTAGDDTVFGTSGLDVITGLEGADCLDGRGNYDTLDGGPGNDLLILGEADPSGTTGTPTARGGDGDDRLMGGTGGDDLDGGAGPDLISGGPGNDGIVDGPRGAGQEDRIDGGPGNDTIVSYNGGDAIVAAEGDDRIRAANGEVDAIDCGVGTDKVDADIDDEMLGCESAARRNVVRSVSPQRGRRTTRFRVRFRRLLKTDSESGESASITVTAPEGTSCDSGRPIEVFDTNDGTANRKIGSVRLRAPGRSRRWCRGVYRGLVRESFSNPSTSCEDENNPDLAECQGDATVGRFSFRVR